MQENSCTALPSSYVYFTQITLMDANYVMDETLGTTSYEINKLSMGQKKMESFLIGRVRHKVFFCLFWQAL